MYYTFIFVDSVFLQFVFCFVGFYKFFFEFLIVSICVHQRVHFCYYCLNFVYRGVTRLQFDLFCLQVVERQTIVVLESVKRVQQNCAI